MICAVRNNTSDLVELKHIQRQRQVECLSCQRQRAGRGTNASADEANGEAGGVTERLKGDNQMLWGQWMNSIRDRAMEIVNHDLIYA